MTVATEVRKDVYTGDGSTVDFPISFEVRQASHIRVTYTPASGPSVVLTQGTNPGYFVENDLASVKELFPVTAGVAAPSGSTITIERVVPLTQPVDLSNQGQFDAETQEELFDLGVMADQQLADRISALESAGPVGSVVAGNGLEFLGDGVTLRVKPALDESIIASPAGVSVGLISDSQHGTRGNGGLHTVATASVAGFQSAVDKARQDALWARTITAGAGLTGGGDLSANRTLDVVAADGSIVVNPDSIQVGVISDAQHGVRGGGTLHNAATPTVAGFMSAADKAKLDGLAGLSYIERVFATTVDATPVTLLNWTPTDDTVELLEAWVVGATANAANVGGYKILAVVRRTDGATVLVASTTTTVGETAGASTWDAAIDVSAPDVRVRVTGAAATIINWNVIVLRRQLTFAA